MEFCRLSRFLILFMIFWGCTHENEKFFLYQGKSIDSNEVFDSLILVTQKINNDSILIMIKGNTFINDNSFTLLEKDSLLICSYSDCDNFTEILFEMGTTNINKCPPLYPFWGEWITVLDVKKIDVNGTSYRVFKLSNETGNSSLNSSGVYWLKEFGIIFINLLEGRYLELVDVNDKSIPWKTILSEVKADKDFSELWEIPPAPPPPSSDNDF